MNELLNMKELFTQIIKQDVKPFSPNGVIAQRI